MLNCKLLQGELHINTQHLVSRIFMRTYQKLIKNMKNAWEQNLPSWNPSLCLGYDLQ